MKDEITKEHYVITPNKVSPIDIESSEITLRTKQFEQAYDYECPSLKVLSYFTILSNILSYEFMMKK